MMAGNPNWWSNMHPLQQQQQQPSSAAFLSASSSSFFPPQYVLGSSNNSTSLPFNSFPSDHNQEHHPQSWSQLILGGLTGEEEEDRFGGQQQHHFHQPKKLENRAEDQILNSNNNPAHEVLSAADHIKQELIISQNSTNNNQVYSDEEFQEALRPLAAAAAASWTQVPASSPRSCVTSLSSSSNILDFSYNQTTTHDHHGRNSNNTIDQLPDQSSECNSTATGGVCKKARVQSSSSQPPLKVRKEKLGDRITALHQLVSPFGKTDTASVLLEAIGYIRFLQSQIEALSSPYMASNLRNRNQHSVRGERSCAFPREKSQDGQYCNAKDLRSRGLCLVPVSVTQHVGSEKGADYWSPAIGGSF